MVESLVWVVRIGNKYFEETKYVFAQTPEQAEVFALQSFTPYKSKYGEPKIQIPAKVVRSYEERSTNQRYRKN